MKTATRMVVDWSLCDGNGLCVLEAPTLLALGEDDTLQQLKEDIGADEREGAERAVRACPKAALRLEHAQEP